MTGTTFDTVGGTSKKAAKKPAKSKKAAEATTAPKARPEGSNVNTVTLPGVKGTTMPIHVDGAMRRLKLGEPIDVSDAELAVLEKNGVKPE